MELVKSDIPEKQPAAWVGEKPRAWRAGLAWLGRLARHTLLLALIGSLSYGAFRLCRNFVVQTVQVRGVSMSPTLPDSACYLANRLVYFFRNPAPGDIVVLRDPLDHGFAVKRIVARPGDSVYVKAGRVYVNGVLLQEDYLPADMPTYASPDYRAQFWVCGAQQYFVLGDNRNNSVDSRIYGAVSVQDIEGRLMP